MEANIHIYIYYSYLQNKRVASIGTFFIPAWNDMFLWDPTLSVVCMKFPISGYFESDRPG